MKEIEEMVIKYLKSNPGNTQSWEYWYEIYMNKESAKFNTNIERKAKKFCNPTKNFLWLTLSPDKFLRNMDNTIPNLNALNTWCMNWFENYLGYGDYSWVIENGSEGDHLHVHALLEMKDSLKHAKNIKNNWNKHFPNNQLVTSVNMVTKAYQNRHNIPKVNWKHGVHKGEYCYASFGDTTIAHDKLTYMDNEKKGSHENLSDTGFRGFRGFQSDIINETL